VRDRGFEARPLEPLPQYGSQYGRGAERSEAGEGDTDCVQGLLRHLGVKIVGYLV